MKKIKKLDGIAVLICMMVFTATPLMAQPYTIVDLIAGRPTENIVVGDIIVIDDGRMMVVVFNITEPGWFMTETHLAVAETLDEIPKSETGNPQVDKFNILGEESSLVHDPADMTYMYGPFDIESDKIYYIAAQTSVQKMSDMVVCSDANETFIAVSGPGTEENKNPSPDTRFGTAVESYNADYGGIDYSFIFGKWIWESYLRIEPEFGSVVDFYKSFIIPDYPVGGTLWITADNGYEAYINNSFVGSDGLYGEWRISDLTQEFVNTGTEEWGTVEQYDLIDWLQKGNNTIQIAAANEYMSLDDEGQGVPSGFGNPAGIIYEAVINYLKVETAWGDGSEFESNSQAMYFMHYCGQTQW